MNVFSLPEEKKLNCVRTMAELARAMEVSFEGGQNQAEVLEDILKKKWKEQGQLIPNTVLIGDPTRIITLDAQNLAEHIDVSSKIDWTSSMGQKVQVKYKDEAAERVQRVLGAKGESSVKADQYVIRADFLSQPQQTGLAKVLANSYEFDKYKSEQIFRENGVWIVETVGGRVVRSEVFNSKELHVGNNDIDARSAGKILEAVFNDQLKESETVAKVSFIHSHAGSGTPLSAGFGNSGDMGFFKQLIDSFEKGLANSVAIDFVAAPVDDVGDILFLFRAQTTPNNLQ